MPADARALPRAPELLTALGFAGEAASVPFFVYPIRRWRNRSSTSCWNWGPISGSPRDAALPIAAAESLAGDALIKSLAGYRIGISISDSENLALRGLGFPKLPRKRPRRRQHSARRDDRVAASFSPLGDGAYGGDLRQGGFTSVALRVDRRLTER